MTDALKADQQTAAHALRDLKAALAQAKQALEAAQAVLEMVRGKIAQNEFFRAEIDAAQGAIFVMMAAKIDAARVAHAEKYAEVLEEGLMELAERTKKADP